MAAHSSSLVAEGGVPSSIRVTNSEWGPCGSADQIGDRRNFITRDPYSGQPRIWGSSNILIENNVFQDMLRERSGDHWECMSGDSNTDVTFRGNRFYNCEQYGIALPGKHSGNLDLREQLVRIRDAFHAQVRPVGLLGERVMRYNAFGPGQALNNEEGGSANGHVTVIGNIPVDVVLLPVVDISGDHDSW